MRSQRIEASGAGSLDPAPDVAVLENISKAFGATQAVSDVSLSIKRAEIFGIVGENGAGKSTIAKMLSGVFGPDSGNIFISGRLATFKSPRDAINAGVAMMAQEINLVPERSVEENVLLGDIPRIGPFPNVKGIRKNYLEIMERSGFDLDPTMKVGGLRIADQQKVELMRALSGNANLIIMDEPSAALTADEVVKLHESIRSLAANGTSVLLVSHFLEEVLSLTSQIGIMRDGKLVKVVQTSGQTADTLVESMVGRSLVTEYAEPKTRQTTNVRFTVKGLSTESLLRDISFDIESGEILGLAGLVGAGRSEIARAIFGVDKCTFTELTLDGVNLKVASPKIAIDQGVFMIPESRKDQGLVLNGPIRDNLVLSSFGALANVGVISNSKLASVAGRLAAEVDLRFESLKAPAGSLSGGNQQKILFGRALEIKPKVLIVDEPTRGVDIAAKRAIHGLLEELAASGTAILFISSEIEEVLGVCHRTLVIHKGRIQGSFTPPYNQTEIISAFFGRGSS